MVALYETLRDHQVIRMVWGTWIAIEHFIAIHPIVVEKFQQTNIAMPRDSKEIPKHLLVLASQMWGFEAFLSVISL